MPPRKNNSFRQNKKAVRIKVSKSQPVWQKDQQTRKVKKVVFVFVIAILSCLIIFVSFQFFKFVNFLKLPLNQISGSHIPQTAWDGENQINLLLMKFDKYGTSEVHLDFVSLAFLNPSESTLTFLNIPLNLQLEKQGQMATVSDYSSPANIDSLISDLSKKSALTIDGYVAVDEPGDASLIQKSIGDAQPTEFKEGVQLWRKKFFSAGNFIGLGNLKKEVDQHLWTNLTPRQLFQILDETRKITGEQFNYYNINDSVARNENDSDGRAIWVLDENAFDKQANSYFSEAKIRIERLKITVLNATKTPGLASQAARKVVNSGGAVIDTGNAAEEKTKTYIEIFGPDLRDSYSVKRLSKIFRCEVKDGKSEDRGRADVRVVVGTDNIFTP